jgi:hypothetical protein
MKHDTEKGIRGRFRLFVVELGKRLSAAFPVDNPADLCSQRSASADAATALAETPGPSATDMLGTTSAEASIAPAAASIAAAAWDGNCELCQHSECLPNSRLCAVCAEAMARLLIIAPSPSVNHGALGPDQRGRGDSGSAADAAWTRQVP